MAGIGFRLQKLLNSKDLKSLALAYSYSAIISSGPWMMSMVSLVVIGMTVSLDVSIFTGPEALANAAAFRITVTYVYAGSLLAGGLLHLGVARYISDRLYAAEMEEVLPCFMRSTAAALGVGFVVSGLWFALSGLTPAQAVAGVVMFQSLSVVSLCMVFLSAAKGYDAIAWGFFLANGLGVGLALAGYAWFHLNGLMWGYALGQLALALWLSLRIVREFPSYTPETNQVFKFLHQNRNLSWVGLVFNLGVWADKFVVWYSPLGRKVVGWFHCSENYDTCLFFAYLTIIPAMTLFLIRVETAFYRNYSVFFNAVTGGGDLGAIQEGKVKIEDSLQISASRLAKSQGGVTLCLILAAPILAPYLGINAATVPLLRFALLAAFLQAMLLILLIFILYFDWQREAMRLSVVFLTANVSLTALSILVGQEYLGLGYLFANLASLLYGLRLFGDSMKRLEFETFVKQIGNA